MQLISKQLDYNLYSNAQRAEQVRNLFDIEATAQYEEYFTSPSVQADLEKVANFILYGKDPKTDKNFCQKKEIQIEQAHTAYQRKKAESLDALLEDPNTKEVDFQPVQKNCYKKIKPTIDREKDKDIPGMQDLWNAIDVLAARVKELKEKQELGLEFYKKNHLLIQLRKEQFALKDSMVEPIRARGYHMSSPSPICYTSDTGYVNSNYDNFVYGNWRAEHYKNQFGSDWYADEQEKLATLIREGLDKWEWVEVSESTIDLTNPVHVYNLLEMYGTLKENSYEALNSDLKFLLWELEDYVDRANLSEARKHILVRKIDKATNEQIRDELQEKFGLNYSDNYISTIYKQMICAQIAKTAEIARDEWLYRNQPEKFKVCSTCHQKLLRDTRNFIKKQNARDGLAARCKMCDKRIRDEKKSKEGC